MMKTTILRFIACVLLLPPGAWVSPARAEWTSPHPLEAEEQATAALIPFPQKVQWGEKTLRIARREQWVLRCSEALRKGMVDTAWRGLLSELPIRGRSGPLVCTLTQAGTDVPSKEGYTLKVSEKGVEITAAEPAGFFNGLQTLRQLVCGAKQLRYCEITDWPAFAVRGFHEDCGRNFQTIESLKRQLDIASRLKINYFHWHLTDDPGWRVQSKVYPQLNDPKFRTRDRNETYSFAEVRELIAYARDRHITVIPELDMPGHSAYFERAFGFTMHSEQGIRVLEALIEEFCAQVPAELCPIVHFGADEVRVPNAEQFVQRICRLLESHGRTPMQWEGSRDLPVSRQSVAQRWEQGRTSQAAESVRQPTVDSSIGYSNLCDPALLVRRWFFMRPCGVSQGDEMHLGIIFCTWPDVRAEDKSTVALYSAQWPGLCAAAERAWCGAPSGGDAAAADMPAPETEAGRAFGLFERRMARLRKTLFRDEYFPYYTENAQRWTLIGPVPDAEKEQVRARILQGDFTGLPTRTAYGACLYFRTRASVGFSGMYADSKPGVCVWAVSEYEARTAGEKPFMIGFDAPARSSRLYSGVPQAGEWSQCGTKIWLNGSEWRNPQVYKLAGKSRYTFDTWHRAANEEPFTDEEIWWAHEPTPVPLKKGKNTVIIEQPYEGEFQSWGVSFIPLTED